MLPKPTSKNIIAREHYNIYNISDIYNIYIASITYNT